MLAAVVVVSCVCRGAGGEDGSVRVCIFVDMEEKAWGQRLMAEM